MDSDKPRESVKQRLRDYLTAQPLDRITDAVWTDLLQRLAPVSESYLRELLRATCLPFDQPFAGIRQHTFEELEESLREMLHVYTDATAAGDRRRARYCRRQVIAAKDRARHLSAKKPEKGEMVQWMLVWLENPSVFPAWVEAKRKLTGLQAESARRQTDPASRPSDP